MKRENYATKIASLRAKMKEARIDIFIVPSNDAHFNEYTPDYAKCRQFLSGFTGSAGTLLVTDKKALLWCDSRYWLQAEAEVDATLITVMKEGSPETPSLEQYISSNYKKSTVAIDGALVSIADFERIQAKIGKNTLTASKDLCGEVWTSRPKMPASKAFFIETAGEDAALKLQRLRKAANLQKETVYLVTALDEIAWLLNLRGTDIEYNPLNIGYLIVEKEKAILYSLVEKYSEEVQRKLSLLGVEVRDYALFLSDLSRITGKTILFNPNRLSYAALSCTNKSHNTLQPEKDPFGTITSFKAIKNEKEIEGFRKAMIEDGVALTKLYIWLEEQIADKACVSETEIAEKLQQLRKQSPLYFSDSFAPIVGFAENGAIVHYHPQKGCDKRIDKEGFLLIDSGAHYLCGTTDITRTTYIGSPDKQQITEFTLVLQGHIDLATARFPKGTRGYQLDILARTPLFRNEMNYLHGTGHGVGFFLNVHEGPQSIRPNSSENPVAFTPGMVTSNEPALYKTDKYGIRTENLLLCRISTISEFGDFYKFDTLTLFPIETKCVDKRMLTYTQLAWLNNYNGKVFDALSERLNDKEKEWLKNKCKPL